MIGRALSLSVSAIALLGLGACNNPPPISSNPGQTLTNALPVQGAAQTVTTDLTDAAYNLTQAQSIGALSSTDPAPACMTAVITALGLNSPTGQSFTPKVGGIVSAGSVAYIDAQQLKTLLNGNTTLPPSCLQLVGQIVVDVNQAALQAAPIGASLTGISIPLESAPPHARIRRHVAPPKPHAENGDSPPMSYSYAGRIGLDADMSLDDQMQVR